MLRTIFIAIVTTFYLHSFLFPLLPFPYLFCPPIFFSPSSLFISYYLFFSFPKSCITFRININKFCKDIVEVNSNLSIHMKYDIANSFATFLTNFFLFSIKSFNFVRAINFVRIIIICIFYLMQNITKRFVLL